ncbi:MAG: phage portal protein [Chloroflexi bacterium]|nr:phage portal protein [Chloroflexota bacterium]
MVQRAAPATIVQEIAQRDRGRLAKYRENLNFYEGKQWSGTPRRRERRLTINYARTLIEKTASYLLADLAFATIPADGSPAAKDRAARAEEALYRAADENALALLDYDSEIDAAVLGDGAFKVTWDVGRRQVRVRSVDVQGLFVWTAADDLSAIVKVAQQYEMPAADLAHTPLGLPLNTPPRPPSGRGAGGEGGLLRVTEVWTDRALEVWLDDVQAVAAVNPYGFIPYVVYPNLRRPKAFWGESDILQIREVCQELNREISNLAMIMELSGNPIAVLENVDAAEDVEVRPGAVWEIPPKAKAYLLDLLAGGGVQVHLDYLNALYRAVHDLGEAPRTAFGDNGRNLSGTALEVELQPLFQKVRRKRLIRTVAYQRRNAMILRLLERFTGAPFGDVRTRVYWGPITPRDRSREIQDERLLVSTGIHSRRLAADRLGVESPEDEFARWLEEERAIRVMSDE